MQQKTSGIHHITAMSGHPQRNLDFYHTLLGLRLVKVTVNQDDPETYHLYYGTEVGAPGSLITFFPWMNARKGYIGAGQVGVTAYSIPKGSLAYWKERVEAKGYHTATEDRFGEQSLLLADPDGILVELTESATDNRQPWLASHVPAEHGIRGFHRADLVLKETDPTLQALQTVFGYEEVSRTEDRIRLAVGEGKANEVIDLIQLPGRPNGVTGSGSVHHIAIRAETDEHEKQLRARAIEYGLRPTEVIDRMYFKSVYLREPGHVLFEIATDAPGMTIDEPRESLGEKLMLTPWLEANRAVLEESLVRFELPNGVKFPS